MIDRPIQGHPDAPRFHQRGEGSGGECRRAQGGETLRARFLARLNCAELRNDAAVRGRAKIPPRRRLSFERARINCLGGAHRRSKLGRFAGDCGQHLLQRAQNSDRVQIIKVAQMRDAEQLALHFALPVGDDGSKIVAELFHDGSLIDSLGRFDGSQRGGRSGRCKQL